MPLETHGRWPLVGAAALLPVALKAIDEPRLRPLAALLAHQTEEWVWPGGFLPWINREVIGSDEDEFPLDRRVGFFVNVIFGWGTSLAAGAGSDVAAGFLYTTHLGNAALHVGWAAEHRRYDPGTLTAIATLAPTALAGLRAHATQGDKRALAAGVAIGLLGSVTLMPALKRRGARR
ncbi:HXXEE domain-containing protein [Solirubrobacter soli]|uniref:HXXEE domain-containing protein n=1 Tax=Solirubrobacter soli TaxID=363832 RepID=UPI0003F9F894|nr:HXXEE domain-containing protein [Solirubrobacter soli]